MSMQAIIAGVSVAADRISQLNAYYDGDVVITYKPQREDLVEYIDLGRNSFASFGVAYSYARVLDQSVDYEESNGRISKVIHPMTEGIENVSRAGDELFGRDLGFAFGAAGVLQWAYKNFWYWGSNGQWLFNRPAAWNVDPCSVNVPLGQYETHLRLVEKRLVEYA